MYFHRSSWDASVVSSVVALGGGAPYDDCNAFSLKLAMINDIVKSAA